MESEMGPFLFRVDLVPKRRSCFVVVKFEEVLSQPRYYPTDAHLDFGERRGLGGFEVEV